MRGLIDEYSVANTVRMARTLRRHASALLVEGSKDVRVYRNLVDEGVCDITPTNGKRNALGALRLLRTSGERGLLVIVDTDFSSLLGTQNPDPDVVSTDAHDLEAMLIRSPALAKLLIEYDLSPDEFGQDSGGSLARTVSPLGYMRLASLKHALRLGFDTIDFSSFITLKPSLAIDVAALAVEVIRRNPASTVRPADLQERAARLVQPGHDPWDLACGHDMTAVIALVLSERSRRTVPPYTIERQLRLSYEAVYFAGTGLCARIAEWEQRNNPYRVLRRDLNLN